MKKVLSTIGVSGILYLLPVVAFARFETIKSFATDIGGFINNTLVPLIFAIAFLVFLWGVFNYFIWGGGDETKREEGKKLMLYAIIGFLLMVSIWGIVNLLSSGLGLKEDLKTGFPQTPVI